MEPTWWPKQKVQLPWFVFGLGFWLRRDFVKTVNARLASGNKVLHFSEHPGRKREIGPGNVPWTLISTSKDNERHKEKNNINHHKSTIFAISGFHMLYIISIFANLCQSLPYVLPFCALTSTTFLSGSWRTASRTSASALPAASRAPPWCCWTGRRMACWRNFWRPLALKNWDREIGWFRFDWICFILFYISFLINS